MTDSQRSLEGTVVLGRYRIVRPLARGGMGMVYLGRIEGAAGFAKPVVIKRVLSQLEGGEQARMQFAREARILSNLQHPGIVSVVDFGEEAGSYLMVLEYVHGYHVGNWLKYQLKTRGSMHWEHAVHVMTQVLAALQHAHTRRSEGKPAPVVHRDISPGNILIDVEGNVRLVDFGIARDNGDDEELKTRDGVVKGKLPYIAPEIYRSFDASPRTDVYSAAVVLYQLLVGRNPFSAKDMSAIITRVLEHVPPPVSTLRDDMPPGLDDVIAKGFCRNPEERFQSASEFSMALSSLLERPEMDVAEDFSATVATDFLGDMAGILEVDHLDTLDAAWREAAEDPESVSSLLVSSLPPPSSVATAQMPMGLADFDPLTDETIAELASESREIVTAPPSQGDELEEPPATERSSSASLQAARIPGIGGFGEGEADRDSGVQRDSSASRDSSVGRDSGIQRDSATVVAPSRSSSIVLVVATVIGAGLVAAGVALLVSHFSGQKPEPEKPRFLLVERGGDVGKETPPGQDAGDATAGNPASRDDPAAGNSDVIASAAEQKTGDAQGSAPKTGSSKTTTSSNNQPAPQPEALGSASYTASFAKRQGAVQGCFNNHADSVSGSPQISVRFLVGEAGNVTHAGMSPAAVGGTALGRCLIGVARSTNFGPQEEPVAFSIPIRARVVKAE